MRAKKTLDMKIVQKIFLRLHGRFGNEFTRKFQTGEINPDTKADRGIENAMRVWSEDLGHLSYERIKRGLEAKYDRAPSCDVFIAACRPVFATEKDSVIALPKPRSTDKTQAGLKAMRDVLKKETANA